jgi:hypothetical protein
MNMRITPLDHLVHAARKEFMRIAESDIRSAQGGPTLSRIPSEAAMAVYDEVIRQEEVQSDLESEQLGWI